MVHKPKHTPLNQFPSFHASSHQSSLNHQGSSHLQHQTQHPSQKNKRKEAKITHKSHHKTSRTKVPQLHSVKTEWMKKFNQNKFFRLRVISRRFNRKLSLNLETEHRSTERKVSWDEEIEIVFFSKNQKPKQVCGSERHRDILFGMEVNEQ